MEKLTAEVAINLLKPIPEDQWITEVLTDGEGKCCAIGHLARLRSENPNNYDVFNCSDRRAADINYFVRDDVQRFTVEKYALMVDLSAVNNYATINGYTEKTPKARVLHLLEDMKAAGY